MRWHSRTCFQCMVRQTKFFSKPEWKFLFVPDWLANSLAYSSFGDPIEANLQRSLQSWHCTENFVRWYTQRHIGKVLARRSKWPCFLYQLCFDQFTVCRHQYRRIWPALHISACGHCIYGPNNAASVEVAPKGCPMCRPWQDL